MESSNELTTYSALAKDGNHTSDLRSPYIDEVLLEFEQRSHGHVLIRHDRRLARCGGPALCEWCQAEQAVMAAVAKAVAHG